MSRLQQSYLRWVAMALATLGLLALSYAYSRKLERQLLIDELERIPTLEEA